MLNWPQPVTIKELQKFLGFSNFYHRLIRNFSTLAAPLTSMVNKENKHLKWTPGTVQVFQDLKSRIASAPILCHPNTEQPFVVDVYASDTEIGAIFSQKQGSSPFM